MSSNKSLSPSESMFVRRLSLLFMILVVVSSMRAQEDFSHPELQWRTIETEHFLVHFHNGEEWTANEVAHIAESIYKPVTEMYQHKPDQKVSIVLRDHDDYSNGAAYFYDNKIEIWAPALDFELRGTHPWLWNVITHEFTHIVQIQTAMKFGRKVPGFYFQWLGYEAERRPDVLYGYPNVIVSYPISGFVVPSWFAEGVAQYNTPDLEYDYWDSHRDMILRMYMLEGKPLSWEEMAVFGKTSLGNESSYNAGYNIVDYIAGTYGVDKLRQISENLSHVQRLTIDGAIESVLGKHGEELYAEWKEAKTRAYESVRERIQPTRREGTVIEPEGFGNFYPVFSPDGGKIAYISNKGKDYFFTSDLYLYDLAKKQSTKLTARVRSALSFSPDARYIYYAKLARDNPFWSSYSDIYRFDTKSEEEKRLTIGLRAFNPKLSADGTKLVFAYGSDGTLNIGTANADGSNITPVTHFKNGEQVFTPIWSPDGKTIAFGYATGHNRNLATVDSSGGEVHVLVNDHDSRDPSFSRDGSTLYFAWNRDSIYNIYALKTQTNDIRQVTNVLGGAFLPSANGEGKIAFALYTATGYKIALVQDSTLQSLPNRSVEKNILATTASTLVRADGAPNRQSVVADTVSHANMFDVPASKEYRSVFTSLSLIPFVRLDNYNEKNSGLDIVKPGFYFISNEVLDKLSLFGGGAINRKGERDLFLIFEYRDKLPLLYQLGWSPTASVELYNITRTTDVSFPLFVDRQYTIGTDVTYNLLEFDFRLRDKFLSELNEIQFVYTLSRYGADLGSFFIPTVGVSPAFHNLYLIGNIFSLQLAHNGILPTLDRDINPVGRTVTIRYGLELNEYNKELEYDNVNGVLVPRYRHYNFSRVELQWNEHLKMPFDKHTLTLSTRLGRIFGGATDTIFHFYAGGFVGMRGYPYYAIDGNSIATFGAAYRFPIWTSIDVRVLQFYFTKLYGSFFADVGDSWEGATPPLSQWRSDAGFELRLESFSFYSYPTRFFFSGAYGFDRFSRHVGNVDVTYGREWRFYLGILFGFDINQFVHH